MAESGETIMVVGVSHHTAPVAVRERWAFTPEDTSRALALLGQEKGLLEAVILSTCNRTEVYGLSGAREHAPDAGGRTDAYVRKFLARFRGRDLDEDERHFYRHRDERAAEHLFRVAGGLDSQIVGESQILGQVRQAYDAASAAGTARGPLRRLFEHALRVGKRVRTQTKLGEGTITAGQAGVELAMKVFRDLPRHPVLLIGSGKIGCLTARAFRERGVESFTVISRSTAHAESLAGAFGGTVRPFEEIPGLLEEVDVIISSTGSPRPIVDAETVRRAMARRGGSPLVVIDLAIPRDFDPDSNRIENVFLSNIDDLNQVIRRHLEARQDEIPKAEQIITEEVRKFLSLSSYIARVEPIIRFIHEQGEAIRRAEIERVSGLDERGRALVERITRSITRKLLHIPTERLKSLRDMRGLDDIEIDFLGRLFGPAHAPGEERGKGAGGGGGATESGKDTPESGGDASAGGEDAPTGGGRQG